MSTVKPSYLFAAALLLTVSAPALLHAEEKSGFAIEEIIVTAQKRAQNLQEVPVAVTAFNEDMLEKRQISSLDSLGGSVPNLITTQSSGSPTNSRIFMRGMGQGESMMPTAEGAVGLYVDDVFVARLNGANMNLFDIERVEVLRGPQGTLYGRNSMTGAIKFVTRQPGDDLDVRLSGTVGNREHLEVRAAASGPIVEGKLAIGGAVTYVTKNGYQERYKVAGNVPTGERLGDREYYGGRLALHYYGSDSFDLQANFYASNDKGEPAYLTPVTRNNPSGPWTGADYYSTLTTRDLYADAKQYAGSVKMTWDLDTVELKSISSYRHVDNTNLTDISGRNSWYIESDVSSKEMSQELQAVGKSFGGKLDWIVGLYYLHESSDAYSFNQVGTNTSLQDYNVKTNSYAGYAQANWHATDSLSFTLGGRYTRDEKSFDGSTTSNTVLWRSGSADLSTSFEAFTPKFGIDFKASDDILVYGSVSKGFKSGGYQGRAFNLADLNKPYDPETVWTYEAGVKTTLLEDRVRFNFAYFYNDFKDLQLNVLNGVTGGGTIIQNAASAKVEGLEVEFTAVPVQNLNVFANFATLWDRYKKFDIPISNVNIASDLAATPTFTMQAGFDYTVPLGDAGGVTFGGDYNRSTPYHPGPVNGREVMIKELNLFNGFIRYQSEAGNWDVGVYAKNILDKEYWFTGFVQGSFSSVIPAEPRTVKLTLNYRFN